MPAWLPEKRLMPLSACAGIVIDIRGYSRYWVHPMRAPFPKARGIVSDPRLRAISGVGVNVTRAAAS